MSHPQYSGGSFNILVGHPWYFGGPSPILGGSSLIFWWDIHDIWVVHFLASHLISYSWYVQTFKQCEFSRNSHYSCSSPRPPSEYLENDQNVLGSKYDECCSAIGHWQAARQCHLMPDNCGFVVCFGVGHFWCTMADGLPCTTVSGSRIQQWLCPWILLNREEQNEIFRQTEKGWKERLRLLLVLFRRPAT